MQGQKDDKEPCFTDNSNPQQGGMSYMPCTGGIIRSNKMGGGRRDTSRVKNPNKIFVGGLPGAVNDHEFREFFEQFGAVSDSAVIFDSNTRRSRGFGFVTFKEESVAQMLIKGSANVDGSDEQIGTVLIRGKVCEVKAAKPKVDSVELRATSAPTHFPSEPVYFAPQLYPLHASNQLQWNYFPYQYLPHTIPPVPTQLMLCPLPNSYPIYASPPPWSSFHPMPYPHDPQLCPSSLPPSILIDDSDSSQSDIPQHANYSHHISDQDTNVASRTDTHS